jgi:predicted RNase H-like HicB family nuclease
MGHRFAVDVEHTNLMWVARVRDIPAAFTQARTLAQLQANVREVLALVRDEPEDTYADAELQFHFADLALQHAIDVRAAAATAEREAAEATEAAVVVMARQHISMRDQAMLLGLSPQRVQQLSAKAIGPRKRGRPREASPV